MALCDNLGALPSRSKRRRERLRRTAILRSVQHTTDLKHMLNSINRVHEYCFSAWSDQTYAGDFYFHSGAVQNCMQDTIGTHPTRKILRDELLADSLPSMPNMPKNSHVAISSGEYMVPNRIDKISSVADYDSHWNWFDDMLNEYWIQLSLDKPEAIPPAIDTKNGCNNESVSDFVKLLDDDHLQRVDFYDSCSTLVATKYNGSKECIRLPGEALPLVLHKIRHAHVSMTSHLHKKYEPELQAINACVNANVELLDSVSSESQHDKEDSPASLSEEADQRWKIIHEPLRLCIQAIGEQFPSMYGKLLDEERNRIGDPSLKKLTASRRDSAIDELVSFCVSGILKSVSSEKAIQALQFNENRICQVVKEGVLGMFDNYETRVLHIELS